MKNNNIKIEAYGVKGMKNTPWRKVFKNNTALQSWKEKNNAQITGTREIQNNQQ